jgi:hypothetical protein
MLASWTQKLRQLSLIQAEKKVVELCSNQSEGRNFPAELFFDTICGAADYSKMS